MGKQFNIYLILCLKVPVFFHQELAFLFQEQEKLKARMNSKQNFLSDGFISDDSHIKIVWLYVVVFTENDILQQVNQISNRSFSLAIH